jgi:hypothetical protein
MRDNCSKFGAALLCRLAYQGRIASALFLIAALPVVGVLQFNHGASGDDMPPARERAETPVATSLALVSSEKDDRIRKALDKPVTINVADQPLNKVLEEIGKDYNIQVWIDQKALVDLALTPDTPVTKRLQGISLGSALRLILRPLQLTFRVESGVLRIISQAEYDSRTVVRIYPVGDLVTPLDGKDATEGADFDSLEFVIEPTIAPTTWSNVGGMGSMLPYGNNLVVAQTPDVHEQIEGLLVALRTVRAAKRQNLVGPSIDPFESEAKTAIRQALNGPIDWSFDETPLIEVVKFVAEENGIEVELDETALADLAVTTDEPITFKFRGIPMKDALRLLLGPVSLTYMIRDEVLWITSHPEKESDLPVRVYPVGDLLECESADESDYGVHGCDYDALIDMITTTIAPATWNAGGGYAIAKEFEGARALVISQTDEVHEQLEALLAQLRKSKENERPTVKVPERADELVVRVYALWQHRPKKVPRQEMTGNFGGFGPDADPPPGVPAKHAATVIQKMVEPESWKTPGVILQDAPNYLIIRQTQKVHRRIRDLLGQLGPWQRVGAFGDTISLGGLGGGEKRKATPPLGPFPHHYTPFCQ